MYYCKYPPTTYYLQDLPQISWVELDVIARAYFCGICPPVPEQQL